MITVDEIMAKYKKIIGWGCGDTFLKTPTELLNLQYLVDSDSEKWGEGKEIPVKNPEVIQSESETEGMLIVIFSELYWKDIVIQIHKMNINAEVVLSSMILWDNGFFKKSFSEYGEDIIIKGISNRYHIEIKHYIDIGANHPYLGNATIAFYLNGASGMLVEPNGALCEELAKYRIRDNVINLGVSGEEHNGTEGEYYCIEGWNTRNTFSREIAQRYIRNGYQVNKKMVSLISLNTLIQKYENMKINYINIDVEGLEYDILKDFDFARYKVAFFNIEKSGDKVKELLYSNKYRLVAETPANWIFVLEELI
jgi:FkbM family methyltransferase